MPSGDFQIVQGQLENSDNQRMRTLFTQNEYYLIMLTLQATFSQS